MSDAARPLARYSAWVRRGDFIFLSGVIAVDPAAANAAGVSGLFVYLAIYTAMSLGSFVAQYTTDRKNPPHAVH